MNAMATDMCPLCKEEREDLQHLTQCNATLNSRLRHREDAAPPVYLGDKTARIDSVPQTKLPSLVVSLTLPSQKQQQQQQLTYYIVCM